MVSATRYLIDTNILLRVSRKNDPHHQLVLASLQALETQKTELCYALQNITEFWNVCTRPVDHNGYGLSIVEANKSVEYIESKMILLSDDDRVYSAWRRLLMAHSVRGVQVQAVHPSQLQAAAP